MSCEIRSNALLRSMYMISTWSRLSSLSHKKVTYSRRLVTVPCFGRKWWVEVRRYLLQNRFVHYALKDLGKYIDDCDRSVVLNILSGNRFVYRMDQGGFPEERESAWGQWSIVDEEERRDKCWCCFLHKVAGKAIRSSTFIRIKKERKESYSNWSM